MTVKSNCVLFVANRGYALTSSRISIIHRFLSSGWVVVVATADDAESRDLCKLGVYLEPVKFNRGGLAFVADVSGYWRLHNIYRKWKPDLVHHFHAKPIILGGGAAHTALKKTVQVVNTITGLGNSFTSGGSSAKLASIGYRLALSQKNATTIFQNRDDLALFINQRMVVEAQARLIISSGVDTKRYLPVDRNGRDSNRPVIVMLGRLLRQKGIPEFVEVAHRIHQRWPEARFLIAGEKDPVHPDAVDVDWILRQKGVEYLGRLTDVVPVLTEADLFLFPSYYREGVPRVVLEASAMGLPTVGFRVPGVREAVRDGQTGYLVPDRDVQTLADRVALLIEDTSLRLRMGEMARDMVCQFFDLCAIEEQYLQVYRDLGFEVV